MGKKWWIKFEEKNLKKLLPSGSTKKNENILIFFFNFKKDRGLLSNCSNPQSFVGVLQGSRKKSEKRRGVCVCV